MRPNILLLVMDATRSDHLSCYGYHRSTTPHLQRLAEDGMLFQNAFSAAPWTPPSFASLFTGCYPSRHKVSGKNLVFDKDLVTLPQVLLENGYNTSCFSTTASINIVRGFSKGFDNFVEIWRRSKEIRDFDIKNIGTIVKKVVYGRDKYTYYMNRMIQKWIKRNSLSGKPFFICAHYHNPHSPYKPPKPFNKAFCEAAANQYDGEKLNFLSRRGGYSYMAKQVSVTEEEFDIIKTWYDGEIAYLDFRINELIQYIKDLGLYENTLTIITADHGENFGEHGLMYHQFCLYDTLIHVPLVVVWPRLFKGGGEITNLVSLVDLFPTILEILNIDVSGCGHLDGKSFASFKNEEYHPCIFAEYEPSRGVLGIFQTKYPEFDYSVYDRSIKCIRTKNYKFIQYSDGYEELYDVQNDAQERQNVLERYSEVSDELKQRLKHYTDSFGRDREVGIVVEEDEEVRKNLRSLGYL